MYLGEVQHRTRLFPLLSRVCHCSDLGDQKNANLDSGLHEVQAEGQGLPHEHVRVVAVLESPLKLFQLPPREVGPRPTSLGRGAFTVVIARI